MEFKFYRAKLEKDVPVRRYIKGYNEEILKEIRDFTGLDPDLKETKVYFIRNYPWKGTHRRAFGRNVICIDYIQDRDYMLFMYIHELVHLFLYELDLPKGHEGEEMVVNYIAKMVFNKLGKNTDRVIEKDKFCKPHKKMWERIENLPRHSEITFDQLKEYINLRRNLRKDLKMIGRHTRIW